MCGISRELSTGFREFGQLRIFRRILKNLKESRGAFLIICQLEKSEKETPGGIPKNPVGFQEILNYPRHFMTIREREKERERKKERERQREAEE